MSDFAIVTGGARGIGAAIAERLKADGLRVAVVDRIAPEHEHADEVLELDLSDVETTRTALAKFCDGRRVTRLVNNAGIVEPADVEGTDPYSIDKVAAVNLRAPLVCLQAALPSMKDARLGRVVNISSRVALGKELRTAYSATKAGLHGMTKTWALELGRHGITVNALGPGPIATELFNKVNPPGDSRTEKIIATVPMKRTGTPEDVADAVSFFCSERAGFVTGQVLYVCGGMTIGSV
ncbi:3-oxoacyl-[acyl-carrier-protein] reductase FabG [Roseovarius sp. THAF27]|uniref:SDR family NAD(P)-dependent oxidoreductase n=1 Tax=Roseovarius sp. THAF27 TaxID=2587850 RepID=UPI001267B33E|nr:SDR family oxidoreductase [Roseovarius sp. THAF27]QFT81882.1 3-oxoacyl-[acyl-carrier-protein] reductase FabG [Roseovarius sp. THAF27]